MIDVDASLLVGRLVSLAALRYAAARSGKPDDAKRMLARERRLDGIDWLFSASLDTYRCQPQRPVVPIGNVDLDRWEQWWMPDEQHPERTASAGTATNLGLFAQETEDPADLSPDEAMARYQAIMKSHGRVAPARVTYPDVLATLRAGRPLDGAKRSRAATNPAAFRAEADRILRTANAPKVAPGQAWEDSTGAVRYTSWCWIPEVNRWSYRMALALGVYAEINGKHTYVGEDHLFGLDQPDHALHETWITERRNFLALVGASDEYTAHH